MDIKDLIINLNVRFIYNAAFLYYNLKGIVAEKYGHDYYNRYRDDFESIFLENRDEKRFCSYGLKITEIASESLNEVKLKKDIIKINEIIRDIIASIQIVKITFVEVITKYFYKIEFEEDLTEKINDKFIKSNKDFLPIGADCHDVGLAFIFDLGKFEHEFSFGPLGKSGRYNIKRIFRYDFDDAFKNSLQFNFVSRLRTGNIEEKIEQQSKQIERLINSNISLGKEQLEKTINILGLK